MILALALRYLALLFVAGSLLALVWPFGPPPDLLLLAAIGLGMCACLCGGAFASQV